jgi:tRNA(fMet)-specific endonuclease VapC
MLILDTDHLTVIQRATGPAYAALHRRLQPAGPRESCTTIVSFEEQRRGWLTVLARSRDIQQEVAAYRHLRGRRRL